MSLVLSTCVLFISQSVNGTQLLNITFSSAIFPADSSAAAFLTVIVPLACIYASL